MSCCAGNVVTAKTLDVEQGSLHGDVEEARIRLASHLNEDGSIQTDFLAPSMHCINCIRTLEKGIGSLAGVIKARANLSTRRVSVNWDPEVSSGLGIFEQFEALGFPATLYDLDRGQENDDREGKKLLTAMGVAGFAAANIMLMSVSVWSGADHETTQLFHLISGLIAIPAVLYSGQHFFRSAWQALRVHRLNMDVPISLAVLLALAMSVFESLTGGEEAYFDASVTLLFFLLVGRYLDHSMRERARGAVNRLASLAAKGAAVIVDRGEVAFLPLKEVEEGFKIMVGAGERIPLDAKIIEGQSEIDRSLVTGESAPVIGEVGTVLEAGSLNLSAPLVMRVERNVDQSFIGEVMHMMEAAEQGKARYVRIADRLAAIYAPVVHILAALAFIVWMVITGGDWQASIFVAIAVLIITCPCALGLAVPIVHVVGAGRMFEAGIMVKDGAAFEKLAEVDSFVFDKTGTLTTGKPMVHEIVGNHSLEAIAASFAKKSSHPVAAAIDELLSGNAPAVLLEEIKEYPGLGMEANHCGRLVRFGRPQWVSEITAPCNGINLDAMTVAVGVSKDPLLAFRAEAKLREGAVETINALKERGMMVEILSGDRKNSVKEIAEALGIEQYGYDLRPEDKLHRLQELSRMGHKICMVGDGINDAPALSAAHVSIAPSSGSDVGRLAADMVFTAENLDVILFATKMVAATNRLVRQNFAIAILYNCIAVPLAFMGFVTPLFAAIAMSASSLAVISNSLRLKLIDRQNVAKYSTAKVNIKQVEATQ